MYLGRVIVFKHGEEGFDIFFIAGDIHDGSVFQSTVDLPFSRSTHPFVYGVVMEGVAYPQPAYGEIIVPAKVPVSEEGLFQIAELDEKGAVGELLGEVGKELAEYFFPPGRRCEVFSGAVHIGFVCKARQAEAVAGNAEQFADDCAVFRCHQHHGAVSGGLFQYAKQFRRVKDIRAGQGGKVFGMVICRQSDSHLYMQI